MNLYKRVFFKWIYEFIVMLFLVEFMKGDSDVMEM